MQIHLEVAGKRALGAWKGARGTARALTRVVSVLLQWEHDGHTRAD